MENAQITPEILKALTEKYLRMWSEEDYDERLEDVVMDGNGSDAFEAGYRQGEAAMAREILDLLEGLA